MLDKPSFINNSKNTISNSDINANNIYVGDTIIKYYGFDDYKKLEKYIEREKKFLSRLNSDESEEIQETSKRIEELEKQRQAFISEVYRLAEIFNKTPFKSQRFKEAEKYFIEGKLKEADATLKIEDLYVDKNRALIDREIVDKKCSGLSDEFLVKAKLTSLNYESSSRFRDTCKYYEDSIELFPNFNNVFEYAIYLQNQNENNKALSYYDLILNEFYYDLGVELKSMTLNNLAILQQSRDDYEAAEKNYVEALSIRRELAKKNLETYMPDVAMTLNNLANLQQRRNDYEAAEKNYVEALSIRRELAKKNPE
ncbi:tetratricopeptide repeat protein, partial [Clostridium sp. WILCCON 0269]